MRFKEKTLEKTRIDNEKNFEKLLKSVKTIQNHWRGYAIRKVYRELKLDKATKAMQLDYFCQQVLFCHLNHSLKNKSKIIN